MDLDRWDGAWSDDGVMHTSAKLVGATLRDEQSDGRARSEGRSLDSCVLQYRPFYLLVI